MQNTPCKDCVFATYDGITQIGCSRGMLDKYRAQGSEILEAYDEEKEFYVLKGRICPFMRSQAWLDRLEGCDDEKIEQMIKFETRMAFHVIIFMGDDLEAVERTVDSLLESNQPTTPHHVTVVRPRKSMIKPGDVADMLEEKMAPFTWRVENLFRPLKDRQAIHQVQKSVKAQYYTVCQAGYKYEECFFDEINNVIVNHVTRFAMVKPHSESHDGIVIPYPVHEYWHFQGDHEKTVPENIQDYQCENPDQKVIFNMMDLHRITTSLA